MQGIVASNSKSRKEEDDEKGDVAVKKGSEEIDVIKFGATIIECMYCVVSPIIIMPLVYNTSSYSFNSISLEIPLRFTHNPKGLLFTDVPFNTLFHVPEKNNTFCTLSNENTDDYRSLLPNKSLHPHIALKPTPINSSFIHILLLNFPLFFFLFILQLQFYWGLRNFDGSGVVFCHGQSVGPNFRHLLIAISFGLP